MSQKCGTIGFHFERNQRNKKNLRNVGIQGCGIIGLTPVPVALACSNQQNFTELWTQDAFLALSQSSHLGISLRYQLPQIAFKRTYYYDLTRSASYPYPSLFSLTGIICMAKEINIAHGEIFIGYCCIFFKLNNKLAKVVHCFPYGW